MLLSSTNFLSIGSSRGICCFPTKLGLILPKTAKVASHDVYCFLSKDVSMGRKAKSFLVNNGSPYIADESKKQNNSSHFQEIVEC